MNSKLSKKLVSFAATYDGLKKASEDVADIIEEMKEMTEKGTELKVANFSKKSSYVTRQFSAVVENVSQGIEDGSVLIDDISQLAKDSNLPELKSFSRKARIIKKSFAELGNKFDIVTEAVATVLDAKEAGTNIKESVVPASEGIDPDIDQTVTTIKVSGNPPSEGYTKVEEGKINAAESVNFSLNDFIKFNLNTIVKSFADFAEELDDVKDLVVELTDVKLPEAQEVPASEPEVAKEVQEESTEPVAEVTEEVVEAVEEAPAAEATESAIEVPKFDLEAVKAQLAQEGIDAYTADDLEATDKVAEKAQELEAEYPGAGEEVIMKIENFAKENPKMKTEELPKPPAKIEVTENGTITHQECPECGSNPCTCEEVDHIKDQELLVEQGIKAFASGDKEAMQKVADFCKELDGIKKGAGEEVVSTIENFASLFKLGFGTKKNFGSEVSADFAEKVKEVISQATEKLTTDGKFDADEISAKCEELEQVQPGAGEIVVSTIENFAKAIADVKEKMAPDTMDKVLADFSTAIEKFVEEVPVADKTFAHKIKKSCFEALEKCDAKDGEACAKFCKTVSEGLSDPIITDEKIKAFCGTLKEFCGRFEAFSKKEEVPAEIAKGDEELNEVLNKMGEKGAQLDAKTSTFATKLCDSYKSMKCFTEAQLETKIGLIEDLKKSFSDAGVNFGEEEVAETTSEVKVESPEEQAEAPAIAVPEDEVEEEVTEQVAPGELTSELVNAEGDEAYDPAVIGGNAPEELVEEEVIAVEDQPSDSSVVIPTNFSKGAESYDDSLNTLFGL